MKLHFWQFFKLFPSSEIDFWSKIFFVKLIYLISRAFLGWTFLNFLRIIPYNNNFWQISSREKKFMGFNFYYNYIYDSSLYTQLQAYTLALMWDLLKLTHQRILFFEQTKIPLMCMMYVVWPSFERIQKFCIDFNYSWKVLLTR